MQLKRTSCFFVFQFLNFQPVAVLEKRNFCLFEDFRQKMIKIFFDLGPLIFPCPTSFFLLTNCKKENINNTSKLQVRTNDKEHSSKVSHDLTGEKN